MAEHYWQTTRNSNLQMQYDDPMHILKHQIVFAHPVFVCCLISCTKNFPSPRFFPPSHTTIPNPQPSYKSKFDRSPSTSSAHNPIPNIQIQSYNLIHRTLTMDASTAGNPVSTTNEAQVKAILTLEHPHRSFFTRLTHNGRWLKLW